jgi:hypothetical protein
LFSVCHYKSCNWVKEFNVTFNLLLLFSAFHRCKFCIGSSLMSHLICCSCLVFVAASLGIGSSSMSHFIRYSCLVFVCCKSCNWVKFDVTFNSLLLFSVCSCEACNFIKIHATCNSCYGY